ncbi:MAG: class I SAM-dependent methyltransferase, partial [Steroidobacter sp.]
MSTRLFPALLATFGLLGLTAGCASQPGAGDAMTGSGGSELAQTLSNPNRPQADRARDADRKPAQLMEFLGVQPGMTALDVIAGGGYMTEVLSAAVGSKGKVYSQNPPVLFQIREAYKAEVEARHANGRLPNTVRVDADLPASSAVPPGSVDVAITALNFHDVYNNNAALAQTFMKGVYGILKPNGVFGVIDHVGVEGANNAQLHRVPKQAAIDAARAAGFVVEAESSLLAHPADDHTKVVFDPG